MADVAILQAGITFVLSASLAVYVSLMRPRSALHGMLLGLLTAFMTYAAGTVLVFGARDSVVLERAGTLLLFGGVMTVAPLWCYVCARLARVPAVLDRPRSALVALLTPAVATFAALATDDLHGLFARGSSRAIFTESPQRWAGPLFWVYALWAYACILAGIALCAQAAQRSASPIERRRLVLVAVAAAIPIASSAISLSGALPPDVRLTPGDLGVSAMLLVAAIVHYRALEPSPLSAGQVIAHLREAFVLADASGRVVDANPAAQTLLGRGLEALRGSTLAEVVRVLSPGEALPDALCRPEHPVHRQTLVTPDERVFDVGWVRLDRASGGTLGSFLIVHERTDLHRAERMRHRSQRLESLGVLVAGIAHEVNNPLAFVRGNLVHLERLAGLVLKRLDAYEPAEADELREMEEVIWETRGGVDRISRIVDATRRLSREPGGDREPVALNEVADGALQMAALHANRGVVLETSLAVELPEVRGSSEQLGQVLLNLLINAKQAVGTGRGRIRLETLAHGEWVEVRVHDDGPGIPAEHRERIFDPFYTTKGPDEGTGLGLAIAFDITEAHGGQLDVGDSELGGACFSLRLPAAPAR